jgi:prevent-host-death family protein
MSVTTTEVGVRELKAHLSRYLAEVRDGAEVTVTDRGRPVARLVPASRSHARLAELIAQGLVTPASEPKGPLPEPIVAAGTVSDLVIEQRR